MLRHKTHYPKVPPVHRSAAWIAHNAGMAEKRKLLSGEHPKIGSMYNPTPRPQPAIHIPRSKCRISFKKAAYDVMCLIGFVTSMGVIMFVGSAVGF